jgi:hypothetical protein
MKEKLSKFLAGFWRKIKAGVSVLGARCIKRIRASYTLCKEGEENLKTLLVFWCTIPSFVYFIFRFKFIRCILFLQQG